MNAKTGGERETLVKIHKYKAGDDESREEDKVNF